MEEVAGQSIIYYVCIVPIALRRAVQAAWNAVGTLLLRFLISDVSRRHCPLRICVGAS